MTSGFAETPAPPPPPAVPVAKNGFARIVGALFSPSETFADIARKPDYLIPLAVIILISAISAAIMAPRVDFETAMREQMAEAQSNLSKEDTERMVRMSAAVAKAMTYISPLLAVIIFAIVAGVLLLAFRLFGGEGTYGQAFSATLYAWMPLILQGIAGTIILLGRGSVSAEQLSNLVMSNLGFLVDMKENPVAFALLSSFDVFTFWSLTLFIIAFSYVARVSRGKSAAIVLTLWGLMVLAKVGFAALFGDQAAA